MINVTTAKCIFFLPITVKLSRLSIDNLIFKQNHYTSRKVLHRAMSQLKRPNPGCRRITMPTVYRTQVVILKSSILRNTKFNNKDACVGKELCA